MTNRFVYYCCAIHTDHERFSDAYFILQLTSAFVFAFSFILICLFYLCPQLHWHFLRHWMASCRCAVEKQLAAVVLLIRNSFIAGVRRGAVGSCQTDGQTDRRTCASLRCSGASRDGGRRRNVLVTTLQLWYPAMWSGRRAGDRAETSRVGSARAVAENGSSSRQTPHLGASVTSPGERRSRRN